MKAQNRKEIFLKAIANGEEPKIEPLTRKEILLKKQAKRESESSGTGGLSIPTYTEDELTQELAVELAKNKAVFFYEKGVDSYGGGDYNNYRKALVTSYELSPGEDDGCGDITPPKLTFYAGETNDKNSVDYEYVTDEIVNEIKAAWGL